MSHEVKATTKSNLVSYQNKAKEIFFFKNHTENETGRLVSELFLFSKNASYEVKSSGLQLNPNIALNLTYNKNKLYKTISY